MGRKCFNFVLFSEKNYLYKHGNCERKIYNELFQLSKESGHVSKFIPLPLSKPKNYRHFLLPQQDIPIAQ